MHSELAMLHYAHMISLYEKALALRREGQSYNEINKKLGIPKSTLSSWLAKVKLSKKSAERLRRRVAMGTLHGLVKRNKEQTVLAQKRAKDIRTEAIREIPVLSKRDLLLIGTALYWAEGYKRLKVIGGREVTAHPTALTNSDPEIVSTFVTFLKEVLGVVEEKIVVEMRLFKHIDPDEAIAYWMDATKLPRSQFRKPLYPVSSASRGKRPKNRLPYGTVQVIVSDTKLFYRVMGFIDGLKDGLTSLKVE